MTPVIPSFENSASATLNFAFKSPDKSASISLLVLYNFGSTLNTDFFATKNLPSSGSGEMYDTFSCIIYDYANTNKNTSFEGLAQGKGNAAMVGSSAYITQHTGVWDSTVAVTSISFTTNQGDWLRGTEISLYGLKSS